VRKVIAVPSGKTSPEWNAADQDAGLVAQKAFNLGLASGFIQGRHVANNRNKWKCFWQSIVDASDPADYQVYSADKKSWSDRQWYDYYIGIMAIFTRLYLKPWCPRLLQNLAPGVDLVSQLVFKGRYQH
jgi:hypothetical protein